MSNAGFKKAYAAVLARAGNKASVIVRASALGIGASLVERSPVDTGRFKNNWQYGAGAINTSTGRAPDNGGAGAIGSMSTGIASWKPGQTIYLTNSMPYARRLEYGWSKQSPSGMVRLAVAEFRFNIQRAAAGIR